MTSESEFTPPTQTAGDLGQPPRKPPTAVAAATPAPAPMRGPIHDRGGNRITAPWSKVARDALELALDTLDAVADTIRDAVGAVGKR